MQRMLPMIAGGLLIVVAAVVGLFFFTRPGGTPEGAGAAPAPAAPLRPKTGAHRPVYTVRDRVVNLADRGGRRYLKVTIGLEFDEALPPAGGEGDPLAEWAAEIAKSIGPQINDTLTTVLASKTSRELLTAEGKERLREEIKDRINEALHNERTVSKVFFTDFIIQ